MSKIQKALKALQRQTGDSSYEPDVPPSEAHKARADIEQKKTSTGNGTNAELPDKSGHSPQKDQIGKPTTAYPIPRDTLEIDIDQLRDEGLHPQQEDVEVVAQQFRRIKRPVIKLAFGPGSEKNTNPNVIMMASALPRTGKTFCSFNLATSIARERDVGAVLVDADVLKPNISRVLRAEDRKGLIDYLLDPSIALEDILVQTNWYDTLVVPAGQQHRDATELLSSSRMAQLMSELSTVFAKRAIVVDTPPLLLTNEAQVVAEHCGQIVLVIEAGMSTQESVGHALATLNHEKPINAILNKVKRAASPGYGGDGYGYSYGYSSPRENQN